MTSTDPTREAPVPDHDPSWPATSDDDRTAFRPDTFPVPWNILDAVVIVLWTLIAQLLVGVPLATLGLDAASPSEVAVALLAIEAVTVAGVVAYLRARGILSWRILGPVRPRWRHVAVGAGVGVAGFLLATVLPELVRRWFGMPPPPRQQILDHVAAGGGALWLLAVTVVVIAPVVEEVVFRGLLFQVLRRRIGLWPGILLSSLTFAIVHLELIGRPISLVALLVLGAWLSWALHRTGSLVVPIVAHAFFNGVAIVATLSVPTAG